MEQNPELADLGTFYGSDYFIAATGIDFKKVVKRLGDAAFETRLIQREIFKRTGKRFLTKDVISGGDQMKRLMDAAAKAKTSLHLSFGVDASPAQVAALTSDIVWMVERVVDGETVLVPQLYLAHVTRDNLSARGGAIVASNVNLTAGDIILTNGRIEGENSVALTTTGDLVNRGGEIASNGETTLVAGHDIAVESGSVRGDTVTVRAGGDVSVKTVGTTLKSGINTDTLLNEQARIAAKSSLDIAAGQNITLAGAKLDAGGDATLTSGGDTAIGTAQTVDSYDASLGNGYDRRSETKNLGSTVDSGGTLNVASAGDLTLKGATLTAKDEAHVNVAGDLTVETAQDTLTASSYAKTKSGGLFSGSASVETRQNATTQVASLIKAGSDLEINAEAKDQAKNDTTDGKKEERTFKSSGNVRVVGSRFEAGGDVVVHGDGNVSLSAARDSASSFEDRRKNGMFTGSKSKTEEAASTLARASIRSGGDTTLDSGNSNVVLKAATLDAGGDVTLSAKTGTVALLSDKETKFRSVQSENKGIFIKTVQKGASDQTVQHTEIKLGKDLVIKAGRGVVVEYRGGGGLDGAVAALSEQPGLAWMGAVKARDDVAWRAVSEAHRSWDYKTQTLSPASAVIITLAVAVATNGMGVSVMSSLGTEIAKDAVITSAVVNAGFTALVSQAALSAANNGGDIGAVLKELGSSATLRSLATSMVTAGLVAGAMPQLAELGIDTSKTAGFADKLKIGIAQATIGAGVNTVIQGGKLDENIKAGLLSAGVSLIGAEAAGAIGEAAHTGDINKVTQLVAHAALGCGMGAASGGDCASGALGGVVGEVAGWGYGVITADELTADLVEMGETSGLSQQQIETLRQEKIAKWKRTGVDLSRLSGALVQRRKRCRHDSRKRF